MTYLPSIGVLGAAPRRRSRRRVYQAHTAVVRRHGINDRGLNEHYRMGECCNDLGFSLKPPKKVRKFIAKHKTALLIGAGVLTAGILAPGAALAVGRGALIAGKFVGRNVSKLLPHGRATPGQGGGTAPPTPPPPPAPRMPDLHLPGQGPPDSSGGDASSGGGYDAGGGGVPNYGGGGGGGDTPDSTAVKPEAAAKPMGSSAIALAGVGVLALIMMSGKKR